MKVQNFYENLSTLHVGTMDNRCWYVPKQDGRESQILLSGDDWKFAWYPSVEEVPEHFWERISKRGFYQHGSALLLADEGIWTEAVHQCPLSHPL